MKGQQSSFTKKEMILFACTGLIVCCFLFPLRMGLLSELTMLRGIPWTIGVFSFALPVFMFSAILISDKFKYSEVVRKRMRLVNEREHSRLLFRIEYVYSQESKATVWEITNNNSFPWNDVRFLITRLEDDDKQQEHHKLGVIPSEGRVNLVSGLEDGQFVRWQVFITCEEGRAAEFPRCKSAKKKPEQALSDN